MIIVTGVIIAAPESIDALKAECLAHSRRSRAEPGCISHDLHIDAENPHRLFFFERWESRAALDAHFAIPASRDLVRALRQQALSAEGPTIYEIGT